MAMTSNGVVRELIALIAALDLAYVQAKRVGEMAIARDAAARLMRP